MVLKNIMRVLCEVVVKQLVPAVRVRVAKELYEKHDFNQQEIASKLGITQAAVSKYLTGKYTQEIKKLETSEIVRKISEEMVKTILDKNFRKHEFQKIICKYCKKDRVKFHGL